MENRLDRKVSEDDEEKAAAVKPARSFRHEDYSTRRVFLRSYPLQWDWSSPAPDKKHAPAVDATLQADSGVDGDSYSYDDGDGAGRGDKRRGGGGGRGWKKQVVVAVVEWGEDKLLLLRRAKKRLALDLLGCHYGSRPALPFRSGGSCTTAMLGSR